MTTRIQTYGPKEDTDPETEKTIFVYYAEARGTDGKYHTALARGTYAPLEETREHMRQLCGEMLEQRMKREGVWEQ